ncbi:serine acetyltransferase [Pseudomonas sp. 1D4]|uniref:serine O-acetyltransferase n=1 Tax=Pseudomonadaceae TaxID=135621 RepID=UPI00084B3EE5|nr:MULTISPECIES: serine O-acetyltransferase [Pseudomonas]OEC39058.1 serine acetyltransferase [Pseudomonas sp. 1D4]OEC57511.1 serine acetyltransferase [Pseudomonas sp. ENNP23]
MWGYLDRLKLYDRLLDHLVRILSSDDLGMLMPHLDGIMEATVQQVAEDLQAYAARDPASCGRTGLILETYASFKAILFHRLAHQVWLHGGLAEREIIAHKLASAGKLQSGAEIHPAARIGRRFVLDHGFGTVIGETCEIGDDCYLLAGVTLGASGIADNPGGKRHPRLGNGVEVGAGARILGAVSIGDNVFISPACVITRDVPANTRVSIVNQLQMQRASMSSNCGFLGAFVLGERLHLVGELPESGEVMVLDADHRRLGCLSLECTLSEQHHRQYRLRNLGAVVPAPRYPLNLRIVGPVQDITLLDPPGLCALVRSVLQPHLISIGG